MAHSGIQEEFAVVFASLARLIPLSPAPIIDMTVSEVKIMNKD
jgi:hypothetical protein